LRLVGVSAPALNENLGKESKQNLEKMLLNRTVEVITFCYDNDGKNGWHGEVRSKNLDVGIEQIKAGLARYDSSAGDVHSYSKCHYELAEKKAKNEGIGIWQEKNK